MRVDSSAEKLEIIDVSMTGYSEPIKQQLNTQMLFYKRDINKNN